MPCHSNSREKRSKRRLLAALTFVVICAGVDAAQPDNNETRKQALAQLQDSDAAGRLAGCTVLAEIGRPEDLPLLQARLRDEDYRIRDSAGSGNMGYLEPVRRCGRR